MENELAIFRFAITMNDSLLFSKSVMVGNKICLAHQRAYYIFLFETL